MTKEKAGPQENTISSGDIRFWQQQLVRGVLRATVVFGLFMAVGGSYSGYIRGNYWVIPIYFGVYAIVVGITLWRQAPYKLQVTIIFFLLYTITIVVFLTRGVGDSSRIYLLTMLFIVGIFFGWRESIYTLIFVLLTMLIFGWAFSNGYITNYDEVVSTDALAWITFTIELLSMGVFVVVSLNYLVPQMSTALTQSRSLTQELEKARTNLEERVSERTHSAELARQEAEAARDEIEKQVWQTTGLAQLSDAVRGEQEIPVLASKVIQHLCSYLDVQVGALFLVDENKQLQQAGDFAYSEGQQSSFKLGEGLIGQAAQGQEIILLTDIPPDAIRISSGLSDIPPNYIIAIPFLFDEKVIGVFEMGAIHPFNRQQLQFLEGVTKSIGIAFHTAQTRAQVDQLLHQTQKQAEELQERQEELRASNEELVTQAENLRIANLELQAQAKRLRLLEQDDED